MRLFAILALSLATVATASAAGIQVPSSESVPGEAVFVVSGRGWGHGVGMSQYGAYGQANDGRSYDEILAYYYYGTELGRSGKREVRVLLAEGRQAVTISATAAFSVVDAKGSVVKFPAGPLVLRPGLELSTPDGIVAAKGPLVVRAGKAPLSLDGRPYRGRLEVAVQNGFLRVVNHVAVESYIQGVVADEMPHTWPLEALKAQAVAARTYALKNLVKGKPFDLYADVRSQVYGGILAEEPASSAAVRATTGQVVTYGGQIASTYYFSTSGGKTASAADVFGFSVPYLISRPDPWDKASPHHRWGPLLFGARTLQSKLGLDARVLDATGTPTPSGRLRSLTLQTLAGPTNVPASVVRTGLGLRSTWITLGVLRLDRPRSSAVVFGSSLNLTGLARAVTSPQLSSSADGANWAPAGALEQTSDGAVARSVRPVKTTRYRIVAGGAASQALLVTVASRVRLVQAVEPGVLGGTVRPRAPKALVHIERLKGTRWVQVAEVTGDGSGSFRVELALRPGTYRARVLASAGLAEGVSPELTVT